MGPLKTLPLAQGKTGNFFWIIQVKGQTKIQKEATDPSDTSTRVYCSKSQTIW